MPTFGHSSQQRLETLHPDLQRVMLAAIELFDFSIVCGFRGRKEQEKAYAEGKSKARWRQSPHNHLPSLAVDVIPWPTQYEDDRRVYQMAGVIMTVANALGVKLRWGGDWDGDGDLSDNSLQDPYHFELVR